MPDAVPEVKPPFAHVVLHQPEIPNNTGNIGRTCVALGVPLHLIHPLGFSLDEKAARRAGLDYWPRLELHEHGSLEAYRDRAVRSEFVLLSTRGERSLFDLEITSGTHLVFGGESRGLPDRLLREHPDRTAHLPMRRGERSLNVAAVACTVLYEALRQAIARGEIAPDAAGSF